MNEKPILFSGDMVKALLAGRKTQTRRIVKPQPVLNYRHELYRASVDEFGRAQWRYDDPTQANALAHVRGPDEPSTIQCKQGGVGTKLWVKETFCMDWKRDAAGGTSMRTRYRADGYVPNPGTKWKPSIFCTRKASRITLEIVSVRVERLQDISEDDAKAEGVDIAATRACLPVECPDCGCESSQEPGSKCIRDHKGCHGIMVEQNPSAKRCYELLWEKINGAGSWAANPWVFVIEFKKI